MISKIKVKNNNAYTFAIYAQVLKTQFHPTWFRFPGLALHNHYNLESFT